MKAGAAEFSLNCSVLEKTHGLWHLALVLGAGGARCLGPGGPAVPQGRADSRGQSKPGAWADVNIFIKANLC